MALTFYQTQLKGLLQNPSSPTTLYSTTDLNRWINVARGRLAGDTQCIRLLTTLTVTVGQRNYNFSSIPIPGSSGIQGVLNINTIWYNTHNTGYQRLEARSWPWFSLYGLNNPVVINAVPTIWSQFGQGAAPPGTTGVANVGVSSFGGSFYLNPPPDLAYDLLLDCTCFPIALTADADLEAIPYLWTEAIPYLAAWYALLSSQMQARRADAEAYMNYYQTFIQSSRGAATPIVTPYQSQGAGDQATLAKMGLTKSQ